LPGHSRDRIQVGRLRARYVVRHDPQGADRESRNATGEAAAAGDLHRSPKRVDANAPAEEEIRRLRRTGRKGARVLEKERPLLREEEWKAREVGALLVDLHLREVGIVGQIERQGASDAVFHVAADLLSGARAGARGKIALAAAEHVRRHDAEAPDGDVMQLERAGARQAVDVELPWNE